MRIVTAEVKEMETKNKIEVRKQFLETFLSALLEELKKEGKAKDQ